jgi:hypothetical protein
MLHHNSNATTKTYRILNASQTLLADAVMAVGFIFVWGKSFFTATSATVFMCNRGR